MDENFSKMVNDLDAVELDILYFALSDLRNNFVSKTAKMHLDLVLTAIEQKQQQ